MKKNKLGLAILASFMTMAITSCNHNDSTTNTGNGGGGGGGNNTNRFNPATAPAANGGGEM